MYEEVRDLLDALVAAGADRNSMPALISALERRLPDKFARDLQNLDIPQFAIGDRVVDTVSGLRATIERVGMEERRYVRGGQNPSWVYGLRYDFPGAETSPKAVVREDELRW